MSQLLRSAVASSVVLALISTSTLFAQDAKQQERAAKRARDNAMFQVPKEVTLSEEQQTKLNAIKDEYAPKLAAISVKQNGILNEEQRTARTEINKANREAKKTGKEAQAAVDAALKLTEEQKAKWSEVQKEMQELRKAVQGKVRDLLTAEQAAKLPKRGKQQAN